MEGYLLLILIITFLLFIAGAIYYLKITKKKKEKEEFDIEKETAQGFINVMDIKGKFLYTRDKKIFTYIKIPLIDISLLNDREKRNIANTLTAEFSSEKKAFKFLAVSRPVDITPLLSDYQYIYTGTSNLKQKELLRKEMQSISNFALSGEIVERQFYYTLWENYEDGIEQEINKRAMEYISKFESAGIKASIATENEIIKLCNLINNPSFVNLENSFYQPSFPIILEKNNT